MHREIEWTKLVHPPVCSGAFYRITQFTQIQPARAKEHILWLNDQEQASFGLGHNEFHD